MTPKELLAERLWWEEFLLREAQRVASIDWSKFKLNRMR